MISIQELQSRVDRVDGFYRALKANESNLEAEIKGLKDNIDILTKTSAVLKHLLDTMIKGEIQEMSSLITYGLRTVFDDLKLSFQTSVVKKNDKICIELKTLNDGHEMDYGSYGGSVAVVESVLLRVICILKLNMSRFMLLDETFRPIAGEYVSNTSKLMGELSKKLGFDVLLVTPQQEFKDHANIVYKVKESPDGLTIEKQQK